MVSSTSKPTLNMMMEVIKLAKSSIFSDQSVVYGLLPGPSLINIPQHVVETHLPPNWKNAGEPVVQKNHVLPIWGI